jgi:hypothetical protein
MDVRRSFPAGGRAKTFAGSGGELSPSGRTDRVRRLRALCAITLVACAHAASAQSPATGVITGRVFNATTGVALNERKSAPNIKQVVAFDEFGDRGAVQAGNETRRASRRRDEMRSAAWRDARYLLKTGSRFFSETRAGNSSRSEGVRTLNRVPIHN